MAAGDGHVPATPEGTEQGGSTSSGRGLQRPDAAGQRHSRGSGTSGEPGGTGDPGPSWRRAARGTAAAGPPAGAAPRSRCPLTLPRLAVAILGRSRSRAWMQIRYPCRDSPGTQRTPQPGPQAPPGSPKGGTPPRSREQPHGGGVLPPVPLPAGARWTHTPPSRPQPCPAPQAPAPSQPRPGAPEGSRPLVCLQRRRRAQGTPLVLGHWPVTPPALLARGWAASPRQGWAPPRLSCSPAQSHCCHRPPRDTTGFHPHTPTTPAHSGRADKGSGDQRGDQWRPAW